MFLQYDLKLSRNSNQLLLMKVISYLSPCTFTKCIEQFTASSTPGWGNFEIPFVTLFSFPWNCSFWNSFSDTIFAVNVIKPNLWQNMHAPNFLCSALLFVIPNQTSTSKCVVSCSDCLGIETLLLSYIKVDWFTYVFEDN